MMTGLVVYHSEGTLSIHTVIFDFAVEERNKADGHVSRRFHSYTYLLSYTFTPCIPYALGMKSLMTHQALPPRHTASLPHFSSDLRLHKPPHPSS